ncbi:tautomerase family protein [Corynebacterium guangdongense]|uniref:Phenylpyruvate tautomerase PptA (4-oxalocrotonate tautomerase family) n=1 Tax=Corynebacterium guangdongense TaxID=1783348 RepID=A0ABU1ZY43_9CORY|nr:tautomerase family protein [Corynebacterium guangdongense]MDR7329851.1 phenylpyruvate tautomerase PptA (4-oxalocrotonate tautomerase family) [Corynebacterium guangdongense]WJZ18414.1 4-oxalocrotonate tautomerase [Corynebacterium guangdongense]
MPTYTVASRRGLIDQEHRRDVATLLTDLHAEIARAPRYLVQVIFHELEPGALFLAGTEAPEGHVWVRADIRSGRSGARKTALLEQVTAKVAELLGLPPTNVWVYLNEIPGAHMTEYGSPLPEPGREEDWFSALPEEVRARLDRFP